MLLFAAGCLNGNLWLFLSQRVANKQLSTRIVGKKYKKSKPFNLDMIYPVFFPRSGHFISAIIFSGRMNIDIIVFLC